MTSHAARSTLGEGVAGGRVGRGRAPGGGYHVKEGTESGRDLPASGKIDKISIERGRQILQHPDQLTRAYERFGQSFERECDAQSVERRATGQIRIADRNPAIHRNSQRLAIPHEWPREGGASRGQTKLNAAMVNEFIGIARRSPLCEVGWRANNGHLHPSRYTDGYHALSGRALRAYPGVETLCDKVDRRVAHVQLQLGLRIG